MILVLVVGVGKGSIFARLAQPVVLIELDQRRVTAAQEAGMHVVYGDASQALYQLGFPPEEIRGYTGAVRAAHYAPLLAPDDPVPLPAGLHAAASAARGAGSDEGDR